WDKIAKASLGVTVNVGTQIVQKDMLQKGILHGYFGIEESWADFLANALVTTSQVKLASGNSVLMDVAEWLKATNEKFEFRVVDIPLWNERQEARRSLSDFYEYADMLRAGKEAREKVSGKKLITEGEPAIK